MDRYASNRVGEKLAAKGRRAPRPDPSSPVMSDLSVVAVKPRAGYRLMLEVSDGSVVERDCSALLKGPIFGPLQDERLFRTASVACGGVEWDNGADISPSVLIWGNGPTKSRPPATLRIPAPRMIG